MTHPQCRCCIPAAEASRRRWSLQAGGPLSWPGTAAPGQYPGRPYLGRKAQIKEHSSKCQNFTFHSRVLRRVTCADGIAAGHEGSAARGAERRSGDVLSQLYPLGGKSVNIRSPAGDTEASVEYILCYACSGSISSSSLSLCK